MFRPKFDDVNLFVHDQRVVIEPMQINMHKNNGDNYCKALEKRPMTSIKEQPSYS